MVKRRKKIVKDKFIQDVLNKRIEEKKEQEKPSKLMLREKLKIALVILALITFFSGGWFPFGLYDKFHISKKEINFEWTEAYKPLFKWCDSYTTSNITHIDYKFDREPGLTLENYNKILPEIKKCVEDKNFRIYLFNNQPFKVKANKLMDFFFNQLSEDILDFKMNSSVDLLELNKVKIITNRHQWGFGIHNTFEEFQEMTMWSEDNDNSQYFCADDLSHFFCDRDHEKWTSENSKIFRLGFLSERNFWTISKACRYGCIADIKYVRDNKFNYIKEYKLYNYIPFEFDNFSDKNSEKFKEYDEIIKTIEYKISTLIEKYEKPDWALKIDL